MFNIIKVFTLAFSLLVTAVLANETQDAIEIPEISQQALLTALNEPKNNIVLLDVRSKEEFNEAHVPGAINISHDDISDNLALLAQYKGSNIVVYCQSGRRAAIAGEILTEHGFNNLQHLTGDMKGWLDAALPSFSVEHK